MTQELIFDLGLNNGDDSAFYLSQGYRVVAVDANPLMVEQAKMQFRQEIESGALQVLNVGIAKSEGYADFWVCDDKPQFSSFFEGIASRDGLKCHRVQVPTVRFASLLRQYGVPYYLKIDIEGHDQTCLADLSGAHLPRYISIESECPKSRSHADPEEGLQVLSTLKTLGFCKFKLIDQYSFCSLRRPTSLSYLLDTFARRFLDCPPFCHFPATYRLSRRLKTRSRLASKFKWEFPAGSSGVWGDDTPGRWLTYEQARRSFQFYRELHFRNPASTFHSFWCDWHAGC